MNRLLLLGGTAEAMALARLLDASGPPSLQVISSLAGRTPVPDRPPGEFRSGGFGGADGLAAWLREQQIRLVVDATHPFASRISRNARLACEATDTPRLLLWRPAWHRRPGDRWIRVADIGEAAARLPALGRRIMLTTGHRGLEAFAALPDLHYLLRTITPPAVALPADRFRVIADRGPFTAAGESALMERHGIEVLVTRASGGRATAAKLVAARRRGIPVVMLRRPRAEVGPRIASPGAAFDRIRAFLADPDAPDAPAGRSSGQSDPY